MEASPNLDRISTGALEVLRRNDLGASTKPAPDLYPHQWFWDSCFIAIGLSRVDTKRAATEILSLLRGQWRNGLVPHIVFSPQGSGYFPGPDTWQCHRSPDAPTGVETSGITDPPLLATAALAVWRNAGPGDKEFAEAFLAEVYPKILDFHRFLYRERDPDGSGLIVVVHPWESGLDNSPPYLAAGKRVAMMYKPKYTRLDTLHVSPTNRPTNKDYDLFVYLLEQMRAVNWNQSRYLEQATLQVQDVIFNSILCRANADLRAIEQILGVHGGDSAHWRQLTVGAVNDLLWDSDAGTYFSRDRVTGQLLKEDTVAGLLPLYGLLAPPERTEHIVAGLLDPGRFWPAEGYAIPTTSLSSKWFNPENYWLGPVWINMNWMLIQGLTDCGRVDLATQLRGTVFRLVERSGYREYFNPLSGDGYGTDSFGWSAALSLDLVHQSHSP